MIQHAFAFLLLVISSIIYAFDYDICYYKAQKQQLIKEYDLDSKINTLSSDNHKAFYVKQMWEDSKRINPLNGTDWSTGYYVFTVLIALSTIIACAIQEYKLEHNIFGIIWNIGKPIIITVIIWIVYYIFKKKHSYFCTCVSDLNKSLDCENESYYDIEKCSQSVLEDELRIKEKANRYYAAIGILLLISTLTLATSFFQKSEYEIEEEQQAIEDAYQKGYEDGYALGLEDGCDR